MITIQPSRTNANLRRLSNWSIFVLCCTCAVSIVFAVNQIIMAKDARDVLIRSERDYTHFLDELSEMKNNYDRIKVNYSKLQQTNVKQQQRLLQTEEHVRYLVFKIELSTSTNGLSETDYKTLAEKTHGYSANDISIIVENAIKHNHNRSISMRDILKSLAKA